MTVSDYLTFLLSGNRSGDSGTASLLGLWDLVEERWWRRGLELTGLKPEMMSSMQRPGSVVGSVCRAGAAATGLPAGIPLAAGSLDHHMAAVGSGVGTITEVSESTGTVLACLRIGSEYLPREGSCVGAGTQPGSYYHLAFRDAGGSILKDYRDRHAAGMSFQDLDARAAAVPPGSDGLLERYLAGVQDGLPVRDPKAHMKPGGSYGHGHHARAIMETVAVRIGELLDELFEDGGPESISSTGGGAHSGVWAEIKADVLDLDVVPARVDLPACLGAAVFAAAAAGWFPGTGRTPEAWVRTPRVVSPDPRRAEVYRALLDAHNGGGHE